MKSKKYISPEITVTGFDLDDVITTSGNKNKKKSGGGIVLPDDEW